MKGKQRIAAVILAFGMLAGTGCAGGVPENDAGTADKTVMSGESTASGENTAAERTEASDGSAASGETAASDGAEPGMDVRGRKTETIAFGEGNEWESWPEYLYRAAADEKFAFAFITVGEGSADFEWAYYDDRETMTEAFTGEKAGREDVSWYFLKLCNDSGVSGMEIYDAFRQHYTEEGYITEAWSLDDSGGAYAVFQEWEKALREKSELCAKRGIIVRDGYLYLLACEAVDDENREEVREQISAYQCCFQNNDYGGGWLMDEDALYWSDHTVRTTTLENPERRFVEERATDDAWSEELMGYYGLVSEAEYRVQIAPDMPEMTFTFRLKEDLPHTGEDIYLFNSFVMDKPYKMEIRTVKGGELIQRTEVILSIEYKDIIFFEDLDEDGYLDMRILRPTHGYGAQEMDVKEEEYWVWDPELEKMRQVNDTELWARREGNLLEEPEEPGEEAFQQINLSVIPVITEKGDSLWKISEENYGDGKYWVKIYEYNHSVIGENPSLIYEGTELLLPWMRNWD